ncbi:MAG: hypothetical protein Q9167_005983 [Letrouitia subvulpina]
MKFLLSASIGLLVPSVLGIGIPQENPHHEIAARGHKARQYLPANAFTNMGHGPVVQSHPSVTSVSAMSMPYGDGGTPTSAGPDYTPPPTEGGYGDMTGGLGATPTSPYGSNHTGAVQILEINAQQYEEGGQKYIEVQLDTGEQLTLTFEVMPNGTLRRVPGTGEAGCSGTAEETEGSYMSDFSMVMGMTTNGGSAATDAESAASSATDRPYSKRGHSGRQVLKKRHVWWSF